MIHLTLPFPPSVNRYWRHVNGKTLISRAGREFRDRVGQILAHRFFPKPLLEELAVAIDLHPPDHRRRDVDNYCKATLDAIEHAGVYVNDSQITHLEIDKGDPLPGGRVIVRIETHTDYLSRRSEMRQLVCCSGCGRDMYRRLDRGGEPYCKRCIVHGKTHAFPEQLDRKPLR